MEAVLKVIQGINQSNPIGIKVIVILIVLTLIQVLRRFFIGVVIKTIEKLTSKTETTLDDELISIIKPALNWLILIGGFWIIKEILAQELGAKLTETIGNTINVIVVFIIGYLIYRSSSILGQMIANLVLQTETELDELLRPLMPKIFQSAAVVVLVIKLSEIFLGQSAGALVGLLGGAGITFGLLLKDIVYDWFCTVIIYSDGLFREGDWIGVSGLDGFVQVMRIGFRTTTLHVVKWGSIIKMPNSRMIGGVVENWSQNPGEELKWGLNLVLKIDGISAEQTARICDAIQQMPSSIAGLSPVCTVRFKNIEKNARVIEIMAFVNDDNLYFSAERSLNLAILEMLEQEGIDFLYVDLRTDPEKYKPKSSSDN